MNLFMWMVLFNVGVRFFVMELLEVRTIMKLVSARKQLKP